MATIVSTLLMLAGIFMILLILVQRGRGGGLAGAFGGMGGQSAFGTKAGDVFTKITVGVAVFWVILAGASIRLMDAASSGNYGGGDDAASAGASAGGDSSLGEEGGLDSILPPTKSGDETDESSSEETDNESSESSETSESGEESSEEEAPAEGEKPEE